MTLVIFICNYNHSQFISETIFSAIRSDLVDTILFTDDGSTDDSMLKAKELSKQYRQIRILQDDFGNIGYSERVNKYVDKLQEFDYILLLDSDDRLIPGGLQLALRRMEKNNLQVVFGATALIDEAGTPMGLIDGINAPAFPYPNEIKKCCLKSIPDQECDHISTTLLNQNWVRTTSNILFSRASLDYIFPIPPVKTNPDWHIALSLSLSQHCFYSNIPFSQHRLHGSNVTTSRIEDSKDDSRLIFSNLEKRFPLQTVHAKLAVATNPYLVQF